MLFLVLLIQAQSRNLQDSKCHLLHCINCTVNKCDTCLANFKNHNGTCISNSPNNSLSLELIAMIITGSFIFLILFCVICIYFARKNKADSSENQESTPTTKENSFIRGNSRTYIIPRESSYIELSMVDIQEEEIVVNMQSSNENRSILAHIEKKRINLGEVFSCVVCLNEKRDNFEAKNLRCEHRVHFGCFKELIDNEVLNCLVCNERFNLE